MSDLLPEGFVLDDAPAAPTGSALPDGFVLDDPAPATGTSELATDPGHIRANQVAAERAAKEPNLRNVPGPNGYSADNPPYKDGAYENRKQPPRPAQPEATWLTDLQSGWNNLMSGFAGTSLESGAKNEADTDRAIDAMKRAGTATPEQIAYLELRKKQIQQDQADAAQTLAIGAAKQAQLPPTPESVQRFNNATGWMDALSAFAADPYTISRSTILQSAPASIPSALGGIMGSILGPMGSSMGAGGGSYITELGGAVQEGLQRFGADMNDPASIMQVWSQHKAEISKYAQTRATVVGGADALTAGISSKFAGVNPVDQIIKGNIKRELLGIGIEAPGGMVGEAGAQLATEGRINQPGQVLAEGLGEVVPGAVQVAGSTVVQRALKGDRETAPQQPPPQPQQPAPGKGDRIEPQMFPEAQKAPVRPMQSNGYDVSPQTGDPSDDEVLHGAGYTPQQIAEMHPAEKAQEAADARAQGVQPKPLPPAPGTAPLAPGFRPTAPVSPESNPAGQIDAEPQVSTGNNSSPEKINSSPQLPAGFVVDQAKSPSQNSQNSALSPGPSESAGNYMPARGEVRAPFTPAPMAPRVQTAIYPPSQADKAFSTFFASKAPITPEALAKASGMPQKDAVKAIQRAALRGSIIQTRQGRWMRAPTRVKPISAMQFIASIGGISDPTGELAGMDLPKMGPYGPVVRKTGLHPDKVREALVEAGYMRDPGAEAGGQATTTVNDVYALLDNEMRGQKAYQPQDQATADALDTQAKNDALPPDYAPVHHIAQRFGVETWNKVKTALDTHGLDEGNWSTQELSDAARMVNEGQDPEDAIVAAAIRFEDDANDPESQFPEVQEWMRKRDPRATLLFDPPPFPDVEPANAGQENADAESPGGAQPLAGSEGPRVEEAPRSPREEAPVPRQDGGEGEGQQPAPAVEQGADNKPQTVLPGAEQLTPEQAKAAAAKDRARKELEIRQRQSKLRKGGQQSVEDQEGGMFAGEGPKQTSMLDQSAEQSSERETYPDGRWKPRLGDKVYQRVPGMFGTPASIVGYVRQNKDGNLVVKMEAGSSLLSGKQSMANKRPVPLSPAWTVMDDPQPARREAEAKAKQDAETQKWKDEMRAEDEAARKAAQDAIAAGADALTPENAKVGLEVFNHRQNQRQIIGEIGDFKEGRVVFTRPVGEEDEAPRSNGPMSYYSIPKKETAPQPDAEEKPAGRINILTNKFKAWFDGSKVVNADGNPLVVYHGTPAGDFTSFDTYASNYGLMGQGGYFTEDPSVASEYTSKGAAKMERRGETPAHTVYPVYLSIKNPIDMNAAPNVEAWVKAYGDYVTTDDFAEVKTNEDAYRVVEDALQGEYLPMHEGAEIMQDGLRAMGHDGITHIGGQYVRKDGKEHRVWIAFDPEQIKSIHNNGEFDRNNPAILSSRNTSDDGSSFAATVMRELAKVDDLFQNPRSDAKTLDGVIGDIVFGFEKSPNVPISEAERALGAVTKSGWRNEDGFDFFVIEDGDGQVWMDISNFAPGLRGSAPYAAVANYAHNVGKVFIGDPSGLSNDALRRRTEAMLSSAIKFGTTRHLEPHKRQLEGDPDLGIPPMEWTYGDDAANVASLINASIANTTNLTPEIANARFDFDTGTFRDAQGQRLSDEILDGWRRSDRRIREARASYSTIRRGVFLKSLAQAERGERPRLLEQALRELRQLVESGDLKATLYNRPGQSRVPPNRYRYNISPQQEAEITADIQATAKRILGRHLVGVEVRRDLSKEFSAEEDAVYDPNTGLIWVALQGLQDPKTSIRHEAIHALRNAGVFTAQEWAALSRMAQTRWIEQFNIRRRYEQLYRERFALNDAQIEELLAEEAIAEAFAEHLVESPQDESLPGRIFTRLRRFLEALRSALRGQGFTSVDQLLEDIDTGKVAAREAGQGQKREFLLYGRQGSQKEDITKTEAFRKWFGDSKVVDEQGRPMVMYHATHATFDAFNTKAKSSDQWFGQGSYFAPGTDDLELHIGVSLDDDTNVMPLYLSIKNPYIWPYPTSAKVDADVRAAGVDRSKHEFDGEVLMNEGSEKFTAWAKSQGYDGVFVMARDGQISEVVAFEPTQIKSIHNNGAFDPKNPAILSSRQERLSAVPPDDGAPGRHPTGDPIREFAASAEAARRLEDLAGNINLRYIKAPEDVKQTLRDVAEQAGGFINARRGKISHEQTARLAAELGMSERELLKRKQGQAFNAEQLFAARALLLQSSKRLTSLASRAKNSGSTADLAEFHKAFTRHAAIQEQIAGMTAEAGRALNQFRMLAGQDYFKQARNIMENAKSQKEFGTEAVKELAKMIDGMKDGVQIGRFTRTAFKTTTMDILRELWINALLSGPRTHATNILSNGLTALLQVPETAVAATISGLRGDRDGVRAGEAMARLIGLMEGAREGMQNARIAFKTGEPTDISSKLEYHNNNAIPGKLGTIVRTPSRALMAADELFKAINYRAEINAQAVRLAMREGVKGDLLARRIADYRNEPTMAMQDAAHEHALYQTFQNAMGPIAQPLMRLRERIPGAWLVLPFIRTPANIFKYAAERTPFGLAMREVRERMASGDAVVRDTQMARLALGGMIALGIASLAMAGLISGGGPNDDDEKKIKRATGWQPYSFKIGDTWYSYQRLDPLGFQIGLIADLWETGGNLESAEADKIGAVIIKAIADGVLNKTYLSGLSDFTEAMNDPDRYADGYLRNFAGTLIPTGVAQVAQSFDPVYRDARTSLDKIKSRIPGLSQALPARRDVFGEAMTNEGALGPDLISPIYATSEKDNPIAHAMIDADYFPGMPRRTIGKHELTPEQYDRYAEISGKRAVQLLQNRVTAANWKDLGRDRQEKIIKKGFDDAREFARKKMMREFPELRKSSEPSTVE